MTESGPSTAVAGAVAVICDGESTRNGHVTPPNLTALMPTKFWPLIVTCVPAGAVVGRERAEDGLVTEQARREEPANAAVRRQRRQDEPPSAQRGAVRERVVDDVVVALPPVPKVVSSAPFGR